MDSGLSGPEDESKASAASEITTGSKWRLDLEEAIRVGDWKAVGTTAALLVSPALVGGNRARHVGVQG